MPRARLLTAADVAKCPHRVALEAGADSAEARALPQEIEQRIRDGSTHREATLAALALLHPEAAVAHDYEETESLAERGTPLILRPRLADAGPARRVMSADVLVLTGTVGGRPTYAPIVIKNNEVTEPAATRRLLEGSLAALAPAEANWTGGVGARRTAPMVRNGFALGHATRVLEAFGFGDPATHGGVIDRRRRLWWFALADPVWGAWGLSAYDEAYTVRRRILEGHDLWRSGAGPFPTEPFWHRACPDCPFSERCHRELAATDDVSLVRFTSRAQQHLLREHGVRTRGDLADLDASVAAAARTAEPDAVAVRPETHLGREISTLDELIYRARSAVRGTPLRKVPPAAVACPVADVEVDVDMESYHDATYLWGGLVTVRRPVAGVVPGYRSFARWSTLPAEGESGLFAEFWRWLSDVRTAARAAGATFAAYCFWAAAEDGAMDRAVAHPVAGSPTTAELRSFREQSPPEWIDLHEVARHQLQTDGPLGLKALARAAGFEWRDEHPSGEASMSWFEEAVGDHPEAARARLLAYNEDDCAATRALRQWLNGAARTLPSREDWPI